MISRKFFSSSIYFTLFSGLPLASGLILLPFYIATLDKQVFGVLTLYLAITLFFQAIILFATEQKSAVDYFKFQSTPEQQKQILSTNLLSGTGFALLVFILAMILGYFNDSFLSQNNLQWHPYLWMCIVTSFCNALFKQYTQFLIYSDKTGEYVIVNLINFIATIGISLWGLERYGNSVEGPMLGRLYSGFIIFLLGILYIYRHVGFKFNPQEARTLLTFVWPIILYFIFTWISSYADRFIINHYLSTEFSGIFDFVTKCTLGVEFILGGLINVVYPKVYHYFNKKDNYTTAEISRIINHYFNATIGVVFLAIIFTIVVIPIIVPWIIHKENYIEALVFLPILCVSLLLRMVFYVYYAPAVYYKKTKLLPLNLAIATVVQLIFSVILISWLGLLGAVIAYALAKFFTSFTFYLSVRKISPFKYSFSQQLLFPLIITAISIAFYVFQWTSYVEVLVLCFIMSVIFLYFFRKEIKDIRIIKKLILSKQQ